MGAQKLFNNFNGGEWSPLLDGRSDLEKYDTACRTLENMRPLPYGGARRRAGSEFIATTRSSNKARLIPFIFSDSTAFILEFTSSRLRFYSNGAMVETTGTAWAGSTAYVVGNLRVVGGKHYRCVVAHTSHASSFFTDYEAGKWTPDPQGVEVTTPYSLSDHLFELQFRQINDVMYLVHAEYAPRKLSRITDTSWTLEEVEWTFPPLRDENTTATTLAISTATVGTGRTLTASAALFDADHIGGYFEIRHLREGEGIEIDVSGSSGTVTSSSLKVRGAWSVVTTQSWYGTLKVQRSTDGGSNWTTVRMFKSASDRNVSASGEESDDVLLRLQYTATDDPYGAAVWTGTAPTSYVKATAKLESQEAYTSGLVKVTGYTDSTHVTVEVLREVGSTAATDIWSEGAWSAYRGYPRAICLFEQRLLLGGNTERPKKFYGSVSDDFENFEYGDSDDDAIAFEVASVEQSPIQWMEGLTRVQIGTSLNEAVAGAGDSEEPVTPSNVSVRKQSAYGSEYQQALVVNDAVVFVQRQGRVLREMSYSLERDGYVSPNLTMLAEHVTETGVSQMAFARLPDPTLYVITSSGDMAVLTYDREQNITAWSRFVPGGTRGVLTADAFSIIRFESIAVIPGDSGDEVWVTVLRWSADFVPSQVRTVERLVSDTDTEHHLDCAVTRIPVATGASTTVPGLYHFFEMGLTQVYVKYNNKYTVATLSSAGTVTLPEATSEAIVGLQYRSILQPMKLEVPMANGTSRGRTRRISKVTAMFYESLGCKFGPSLDQLEELPFNTTSDELGELPTLFTGDKDITWNGGNEKGGDLYIIQDKPYPMTVLGLAVKFDVFES
jgi:hypothetical protein